MNASLEEERLERLRRIMAERDLLGALEQIESSTAGEGFDELAPLLSMLREAVEARTSFACVEPEEDGFYLFKARQGHQLGPVRVVHLVIRGGEPYEANASDPFDWHGLLAGPIPLPSGWDATDTAQIFAPPEDLAGRNLKRYNVRDLP